MRAICRGSGSITVQYCSGIPIYKGDAIAVGELRGTVEELLVKGTSAAENYRCLDTGGLLLRFENGDLQVWPYMNEDLKLLQRKG